MLFLLAFPLLLYAVCEMPRAIVQYQTHLRPFQKAHALLACFAWCCFLGVIVRHCCFVVFQHLRGSALAGKIFFGFSTPGTTYVPGLWCCLLSTRAVHGSGSVENITGRVGSGRIGSRGFKCCRSGQVGSGQDLFESHGSGRVGSGQEAMKSSRVGSGHEPRGTSHSWGRASMTRELFPADAGGRTRACGPRIRHLKNFLLAAQRLLWCQHLMILRWYRIQNNELPPTLYFACPHPSISTTVRPRIVSLWGTKT